MNCQMLQRSMSMSSMPIALCMQMAHCAIGSICVVHDMAMMRAFSPSYLQMKTVFSFMCCDAWVCICNMFLCLC